MYIKDGEKLKEYKISGDYPKYSPDTLVHYTYSTVLDEISLLNNEETVVDLSSVKILKIETDSDEDSYDEPHKIIIEWGDGKKDVYNKRIDKPVSNIGGLIETDWKIFSHNYSFDESLEESSIKITCINKYGTGFTFILPYKIIYKTLTDIGTKIKIISANITNEGKTSYVLKHVDTDSIVFLSSN